MYYAIALYCKYTCARERDNWRASFSLFWAPSCVRLSANPFRPSLSSLSLFMSSCLPRASSRCPYSSSVSRSSRFRWTCYTFRLRALSWSSPLARHASAFAACWSLIFSATICLFSCSSVSHLKTRRRHIWLSLA